MEVSSSKRIERLLKITSHYMMGELEKIISFDSLSDEQKEQTIQVALKSLETSAVVADKVVNERGWDDQLIDKTCTHIDNDQFEDAYNILFKN